MVLVSIIIASTILVSTTQAQRSGGDPTFGLELKYGSSISLFDGGQGEPINNWVHHNGLLWSEVEKTPGTYNWESTHVKELNSYLEKMHNAGMEVILIIRSTPEWARSHDQFCGPMDSGYIDDFADFVAQAVSKFSQAPYYVEYFEIWNEPDAPQEFYDDRLTSQYGCWGDPYDPQGYFGGTYYGQMLKQVYPKLKVASKDAQLVIGGLLLPADPEDAWWSEWTGGRDWVYSDMSKFIEGIFFECQGTECFDLVNFHGYSYYGAASAIELELLAGAPHPFWDERGGQVSGKLAYIKQLMNEYSVDKPIILTEAALLNNYTYDYDPAFEATKADYVVYLFTRNIALDIKATIWHTADYYGWQRSGLLDWNNNPLPAYHAYETLTKMLDGAVYAGELDNLGQGIIGFRFTGGNAPYWVLFSEDGSTKQITASQLPIWFHSANDLFGNQIARIGTTAPINFNRPIYIKGNSAPIAYDDLYILNEGAPLTVAAPGVFSNDLNYDKDTLTATLVSGPSAGSLQLNANGSFTYTPSTEFTGEDTFTYKASDGVFTSNVATVTIIDGTWLYLPIINR